MRILFRNRACTHLGPSTASERTVAPGAEVSDFAVDRARAQIALAGLGQCTADSTTVALLAHDGARGYFLTNAACDTACTPACPFRMDAVDWALVRVARFHLLKRGACNTTIRGCHVLAACAAAVATTARLIARCLPACPVRKLAIDWAWLGVALLLFGQRRARHTTMLGLHLDGATPRGASTAT